MAQSRPMRPTRPAPATDAMKRPPQRVRRRGRSFPRTLMVETLLRRRAVTRSDKVEGIRRGPSLRTSSSMIVTIAAPTPMSALIGRLSTTRNDSSRSGCPSPRIGMWRVR